MIYSKKDFYVSIEGFYSEEEIQKMFNLVENIEETNMSAKEVYNLLKNDKPRDVNVILAMAYFEELDNAQMKIFLAEKAIIRDNLIAYRNSIRNNTMREFVSNYKPEDFFYLEELIMEDEYYLDDSQKDLYVNELKYLNGEIECAIPTVEVKKKRISHIEKK